MWNISDLFSFDGCPCPDVFKTVDYPWEVLGQIRSLIEEVLEDSPGKYRQIGESVWIGRGTTIADSAVLTGPAVIGEYCEIRPNAYIRGNVITGDGVVLGNAVEVKQAVLFSGVQLPHYNYVGDSILGQGAHLGAGAIISNFRSIKGSVKVKLGERVLETGLRKFGAAVGDEVEIGCNAVLNPGTIVGRRAVVYPLTSVRGFVPADMILKGDGEVVPRL